MGSYKLVFMCSIPVRIETVLEPVSITATKYRHTGHVMTSVGQTLVKYTHKVTDKLFTVLSCLIKHTVVPQKFHFNVTGSPHPHPADMMFRQLIKAKHSINMTPMKKYQKFYDRAEATH